MTRTSGQSTRRRAIANAASGHTAVILYACTPDPCEAADAVGELRAYATARGWLSVGTVIDCTDLELPMDARPEWSRVEALITSQRANGVLTLCPDTYGPLAADQARVVGWLAKHHAFTTVTRHTVADGVPQQVGR